MERVVKWNRRNSFIVAERWVAGDVTLFPRLMAELRRAGYRFTDRQHHHGLKVYLTLDFGSEKVAKHAAKWIDKKFEV